MTGNDCDLNEGHRTTQRLSIIGLDYQIINGLAKRIHAAVRKDFDYTALRDTSDKRGRSFEVMLENGRVAKVTVELDRVESW